MIPAEAAHDTIAALGEAGLLQFKDLNADKTAFQRAYAAQVCGPPRSQPSGLLLAHKPLLPSITVLLLPC